MLSDEGEFKLPSERVQRLLEEQLAGVVEGEGVVISGLIHGGEGIYLGQEPNIIQLNQPRRRRRRIRARGPIASVIESAIGTDASSIAVGLKEQPSGGFKITSIKIKRGEHVRSPFVVSLRGMSLTSDETYEDERLPFSEVAAFDVEPASLPSIETIGAIADDLYLRPSHIESGEQFTSDSIKRSWLDRVASDIAFAWFKLKQRAQGAGRRAQESFHSPFAIRHTSSLESLFKPASKPSEYVLEIEDERIPSKKIALDLDIDPSSGDAIVTGTARQDQPLRPTSNVQRPRIIRSLATLSLLILIVMIPANVIRLVRDLKAKQAAVAAASDNAIGALGSIGTNGNLQGSIEAMQTASGEFRTADTMLAQTNALAVGLASLLPSTHASYTTARALMEIGDKTTSAGQLLAKGLNEALTGGGSLLERIASVRAYAQGALPLLEDSAKAFTSVDAKMVPEKDRAKVAQLGSFVDDSRSVLREFIGMSDLLTTMLGKDGKRRYLVIFQNPTELRATGGFMGSYAELDVDQGQIARLEVPGGGTYDLQGQLTTQVLPPKPLQLVASRWEFQDSNWSPDFPTAAKKIEWFWSKSGGYTLDGVIAVNATIVEKMLALTGPIEVPELGKTISADNFIMETQKAVELEYDKTENKPKKILGLLAPRLMERIKQLDSKGMLKFVSIISDSMEQKDIQISLADDQEDAQAQSYGWSGRIKETKGDALAIIGSNIAGQKTDAVIRETAKMNVRIADTGRITDSVSIKREHTGKKGDLFNGVRNVEYFRFYIPRGSTLVNASGFDVIPSLLFHTPREDAKPDADLSQGEDTAEHMSFNVDVWDEGDRTVIGGWTMLDPGQTETLSIEYRLPFTASDLRERVSQHVTNSDDGRTAYELLLTSQSGKPDRSIDVSVATPASWTAHWIRSTDDVNGAWTRDRVVSALFETKTTSP